jgi:hypothetical protein
VLARFQRRHADRGVQVVVQAHVHCNHIFQGKQFTEVGECVRNLELRCNARQLITVTVACGYHTGAGNIAVTLQVTLANLTNTDNAQFHFTRHAGYLPFRQEYIGS